VIRNDVFATLLQENVTQTYALDVELMNQMLQKLLAEMLTFNEDFVGYLILFIIRIFPVSKCKFFKQTSIF